MGILLSSANDNELEMFICNGIQLNEDIKETLLNIIKIPDFAVDEIVINEILKKEKIFIWGSASEIRNVIKGDTLYLLNKATGMFEYRAYITTIIRNQKLAKALDEDIPFSNVYIIENIEAIDIEKSEHLLYFGLLPSDELKTPIYIKDVYQEISGYSEDEFQKVIYNEEKSENNITKKAYIEAYASIEACEHPDIAIGDIVLLGTEGEGKFFNPTTSKNIQRMQNIFNYCTDFRTSYSHVALCVAPGVFIEAKGKDRVGVVYSTHKELFKVENGKKYAKYARYFKLTYYNTQLISERSLYYAGTPYPDIRTEPFVYWYNKIVKEFKPQDANDEFFSFCSDLISQILKEVKNRRTKKSILLIEKSSKVILPWDIEKYLENSQGWWLNTDNNDQSNRDYCDCEEYRILAEVHKKYFLSKQESLSKVREFYVTREDSGRVPLWFRMKIYHQLKQGSRGEIKAYLARKSLYELLRLYK